MDYTAPSLSVPIVLEDGYTPLDLSLPVVLGGAPAATVALPGPLGGLAGEVSVQTGTTLLLRGPLGTPSVVARGLVGAAVALAGPLGTTEARLTVAPAVVGRCSGPLGTLKTSAYCYSDALLALDGLALSSATRAQPTYALFDRLTLDDSLTVTAVVSQALTEGLDLTTAIRYVASALAETGFDLAALTTAHREALLVLAETLDLADQFSAGLQTGLTASTTLHQTTRINELRRVLAREESFSLSATVTPQVTAHPALAETLGLSEAATNTLAIAEALMEELALAEAAQMIRTVPMSASATATLADNLTWAIRAELLSSETLTLASELTGHLTFVATADDSFGLDATGTMNVAVLFSAQDVIAFVSRLPLGDENFSAWILNADTTGVTTYSQFPMNSLMTLDGIAYGLTDTGLYELTGDTDDGEPIDAWLATGDIDFGTSREKNVPRCYLYQTQGGALVLKTISSRHGRRAETYYELALRDPTDDGALRRVPLGRGVRGVTWRFEIHNVDGADLDLSGAEVMPVVLSRRG